MTGFGWACWPWRSCHAVAYRCEIWIVRPFDCAQGRLCWRVTFAFWQICGGIITNYWAKVKTKILPPRAQSSQRPEMNQLIQGSHGTGISEIVHAPNLKNKIGAGSALILSLRNSGENPNWFNVKEHKKRAQTIYVHGPFYGITFKRNSYSTPNSHNANNFQTKLLAAHLAQP